MIMMPPTGFEPVLMSRVLSRGLEVYKNLK